MSMFIILYIRLFFSAFNVKSLRKKVSEDLYTNYNLQYLLLHVDIYPSLMSIWSHSKCVVRKVDIRI